MSKLVLVPTPIGNLEDITRRALRVLNEVHTVLAEDTRKAGILLTHYGIRKKIQSHHTFNEHKFIQPIVQRILAGESMALISEAGTPGISDPGFLLVRHCLENDVPVECLPGPTAFVPALAVSGLPMDRFCFEGFLPAKKGRNRQLQKLSNEERTMVLYESPHRLLKTLEDIRQVMGGERKASISRELSKLHEETLRGDLNRLIGEFSGRHIKGEFVIVLEGLK